jgi:hypothetical protein
MTTQRGAAVLHTIAPRINVYGGRQMLTLFSTDADFSQPTAAVLHGLAGDAQTLADQLYNLDALDTVALDHVESDLDAIIDILHDQRKRISHALDRRDATPMLFEVA